MSQTKRDVISTKGTKQTYFVLPENVEKLKRIKETTKIGYSNIINQLIEQKYLEIFKENIDE